MDVLMFTSLISNKAKDYTRYFIAFSVIHKFFLWFEVSFFLIEVYKLIRNINSLSYWWKIFFSQLSVLNLIDSDLIYILTEVLNFYESPIYFP